MDGAGENSKPDGPRAVRQQQEKRGHPRREVRHDRRDIRAEQRRPRAGGGDRRGRGGDRERELGGDHAEQRRLLEPEPRRGRREREHRGPERPHVTALGPVDERRRPRRQPAHGDEQPTAREEPDREQPPAAQAPHDADEARDQDQDRERAERDRHRRQRLILGEPGGHRRLERPRARLAIKRDADGVRDHPCDVDDVDEPAPLLLEPGAVQAALHVAHVALVAAVPAAGDVAVVR